MLPRIVEYINTNPRTQIVLVKDIAIMQDCVWLDLGKELSKYIQMVRNSNLLSALTWDKLNDLIGANTETDDAIGDYIALKNTNILLEPELQIDVRSLLEQWGKTQTIIFQLNQNTVKEHNKFYLEKYDNRYYIDLEGLSYILIE